MIRQKRCNSCVLPSTFPGIEFDDQGICNYCRLNKKSSYIPKDIKNTKKKHNGKYDVIIMVSGGKDSSYVLYQLVKKHHFKVLAYNFDNSFSSETAKKNLENITSELGVKLIVEKPNQLFKKLMKNMVLAFRNNQEEIIPRICFFCNLARTHNLLKISEKYDIPLIFTGIHRGDKQILWQVKKKKNNSKKILNTFFLNPNYYFLSILYRFFYFSKFSLQNEIILYESGTQFGRSTLHHYFDYEEYNIEKIDKTMKKITWSKSKNNLSKDRFDCQLSFLKNYFRQKKHGYSLFEKYYSRMIYEGEITRKKAIEKINKNKLDTSDDKLVKKILGQLGINKSQIKKILE